MTARSPQARTYPLEGRERLVLNSNRTRAWIVYPYEEDGSFEFDDGSLLLGEHWRAIEISGDASRVRYDAQGKIDRVDRDGLNRHCFQLLPAEAGASVFEQFSSLKSLVACLSAVV